MKKIYTQIDRIEYLKNWLISSKITPKHNHLVPEWLTAEMLRLTPDDFVMIVLLDDCPLKPVHKAGGRFYRLEDIAEFIDIP